MRRGKTMNDLLDTFLSRKITSEELGVFSFARTILFYEHPIVFICSKANDAGTDFYAFIETDDSAECYGWNISEVSLFDINLVNKGDKSVQYLFNKPGNAKYHLLFDLEHNVEKCRVLDSFEGVNAVEGETYITDFCDMDEAFDYHHFLQNAKADKEDRVSIVFEGDKPPIVEDVLSCIKTMNSLGTGLDFNKARLQTLHNSTVFSFIFEDESHPLLDNAYPSKHSEGIKKIKELLSNTEEVGFLETGDNKEKVKNLKKYNKLLDTFSLSSDLRPKLVVTSLSDSKQTSFKMDKINTFEKKSAVKKAIDYIENHSTVKEDDLIVVGFFDAAKVSASTFTFVENVTGNQFSGKIDCSKVDPNVVISLKFVEYEATIKRKRILNNQVLQKEAFYLIGLKEIGRKERKEQILLPL